MTCSSLVQQKIKVSHPSMHLKTSTQHQVLNGAGTRGGGGEAPWLAGEDGEKEEC